MNFTIISSDYLLQTIKQIFFLTKQHPWVECFKAQYTQLKPIQLITLETLEYAHAIQCIFQPQLLSFLRTYAHNSYQKKM